jgi:hypothetical protein
MWEDCLDEFRVRSEKWIQIVSSKDIRKGYFWLFKSAQDASRRDQTYLFLSREYRILKYVTATAVLGWADRHWKWLSIVDAQAGSGWPYPAGAAS